MTMEQVFTRADAFVEIKRIIEAGAALVDEFDMDAVLDEIGGVADTEADRWDVAAIDSATFWDIMQRHAREL